MEGLYKRERHDTFTPDGWYKTGDLGWFGSDGHLRFTGRRTGMIKTAGSNVSPAEVEVALLGLPEVRSAIVFGIPAGDRGEDVAAVVVPELSDLPAMLDLRSALRAQLASYKIPRHLKVMAEGDIPVLATGKPDLVALRDLFRNQADGEVAGSVSTN
jgi:acyl-CoA synthetase (AMP-forming)/AMP-acid ligase II